MNYALTLEQESNNEGHILARNAAGCIVWCGRIGTDAKGFPCVRACAGRGLPEDQRLLDLITDTYGTVLPHRRNRVSVTVRLELDLEAARPLTRKDNIEQALADEGIELPDDATVSVTSVETYEPEAW